MKFTRLGRSGLEVSRLCLGCMSYGAPGRGMPGWSLDEEESRGLICAAVEAGVNFFDTANIYSAGHSEEIVGRAVRDFARREDVVISTKVMAPMRQGPNAAGLSRKSIFQEIDASLTRLGTDYVDIYQIHRFDSDTPIEETLEALHDVVKAGKARYLAASSMHAWQFATMLHTAERNGWTRFIAMQNHLNLLYREEEREMLPLCLANGVGITPWSPLARGQLVRDEDAPTTRSAEDPTARKLYDATIDADRRVIDAVAAIASERGVARAAVALAWLLQKPGVAAPVVGITRPPQLQDAVKALGLKLSCEEIEQLEMPYMPHAVAGIA